MKNKPWSTQKLLKKKEIPERGQIISIANSIPHLRNRALFIISYLTGGRISEIVKEPYSRQIKYAKEIIIDSAGNKKEIIARNSQKSPIQAEIQRKELGYKGLRRDNITWSFRDGRRILIISMPNRKNKKQKRKRIPIPYDKEKELLDLLMQYLEPLGSEELLFPFSKSKAEKIIKDATGMNPHFLRDIRATRLVLDHNFNEYKLQRYMGWSDGRPAARYVLLNENSILGGDY